MDFSGLINDLQDWEHSMKDKGVKVKVQSQDGEKMGSRSPKPCALDKAEPNKKANLVESSRNADRKLYMGSEAISQVSSSLFTEENSPDATSEKELGNKHFNQKKYNEAIDCYSRSIALSPTAVAFANRAMAYLKIKRFKDAENDCTEALNLDNHYIKAYSRRATARRELGELKASFKDLEFALKLEPENQELKKQHADAKALYTKEIADKVSCVIKKAALEKQIGASTLKTSHIEENIHKVSSAIKKPTLDKQVALKTGYAKVPGKSSIIIEEIENQAKNTTSSSTVLKSDRAGISSSNILKKGDAINKQEKRMLLQDIASKASSLARSEAAKNIAPPKSAYQFESSWRGLSGDQTLQARFLKAIAPVDLPKLFGNALSSPVLIDIVKCVSTFFMEEIELSIEYLENLTHVSRFDVIIMCVSAADKADLYKLWEMVFLNEAVPIQYVNKICSLHSKYIPKCV